MTALAATKLLIWHHYNGFPKKKWTVAGRLFQARMWREYARAIRHDIPTMTGVGRRWVLEVARYTEAECLRRARVNIYLAKRLNRKSTPPRLCPIPA